MARHSLLRALLASLLLLAVGCESDERDPSTPPPSGEQPVTPSSPVTPSPEPPEPPSCGAGLPTVEMTQGQIAVEMGFQGGFHTFLELRVLGQLEGAAGKLRVTLLDGETPVANVVRDLALEPDCSIMAQAFFLDDEYAWDLSVGTTLGLLVEVEGSAAAYTQSFQVEVGELMYF